MKNQKVLIAVSIIIILVSITTGIYLILNPKDKPEFKIEGIDTAENKEILKDTTVEELKITDISLLTREGISTFQAKITNPTNKEVNINTLYVIFYEEQKENKVPVLQNIKLVANDSTYINITSDTDLSKTTKIEYSIEK